MEEAQRETYSQRGGNGWPGARCSDAARRDATLLPEAWCNLLLSCFLPGPPFFDIHLSDPPVPVVVHASILALLMLEADEAIYRHIRFRLISTTWL